MATVQSGLAGVSSFTRAGRSSKPRAHTKVAGPFEMGVGEVDGVVGSVGDVAERGCS